VSTWLEAFAAANPENGDLADDLNFDLIGGDDEVPDEEDNEDDDDDEEPPEVRDPNTQSYT
jgi:hypothetical protein